MSEPVLVPWVQDIRHNAPKFILPTAWRQPPSCERGGLRKSKNDSILTLGGKHGVDRRSQERQ